MPLPLWAEARPAVVPEAPDAVAADTNGTSFAAALLERLPV